MGKLLKNRIFWIVLLSSAILIFPFMGMADFYSKGEPREAIVSYTMLETGNWILPHNIGGEIAYKPPFFHWCVAAVSLLAGGVNEVTARIPSGLALLALSLATYFFFARRKGETTGALTALVLITSFELHRAGTNCRVDMVLTALITGAIYLLYRWQENGMRGIPWIAVTLMGLATLTKGPVGSAIPCLVMGTFMLARKERFHKALLLMAAFGLLSLLAYAAWFWAAYWQEGKTFLNLVYEENIGRMTGTMTYESHVNPWYYNVISIIAGLVPVTVMLLITLFYIKVKWLKGWSLKRWHRMSGISQYSLVAAVVIFVFYCIPASKRSVYLMPMFPFLAYFVARLMMWLSQHERRPLRIYRGLLIGVSFLPILLLATLKTDLLPDTLLGGHGHHAATNMAIMQALKSTGAWWQIALALVPASVGTWCLTKSSRKGNFPLINHILLLTMAIFLSLDGVFTPAALNAKSQKPIAATIDQLAPAGAGTLYEYIDMADAPKGNPPHFFELNFYLKNRIHIFEQERPESGYLLVNTRDYGQIAKTLSSRGYGFAPIRHWEAADIHLLRFQQAIQTNR